MLAEQRGINQEAVQGSRQTTGAARQEKSRQNEQDYADSQTDCPIGKQE